MELEFSLIILLAGVALAAGFFDAIAGGGGLVTLPALLLAGIDPVSALATNKFQAASASVSATATFARKGMIEWRRGLPMAAVAMLGGAGGALSANYIPATVFQAVVPVLLVAVAAYFAFSPKLDEQARRARLSAAAFCLTLVPMIGFYDGLFGPGVGSFYMLAFVLLLGQGVMRAVCNSKLLNAACNLGALLVFGLLGNILWPLALAMGAAAFIGAQLGARCAVHFGPTLIKPMLITVCCLMAGKLLMTPGNPWQQWITTCADAVKGALA
ncbi:TSUP family transporter [Pseudomonas sp. KNUC1026]|uniref:TSUP family transporter n=1 Tax=Pseudomonas sp. KNUC1026 TaxID=2893890 RepID=UPI001F1A5E83|nr:TSUP family transporter [Pseudomonas sp. KNUC1026]UFH48170.1 TSUP family transporter [Pseudomonas sp. KNUC1026]